MGSERTGQSSPPGAGPSGQVVAGLASTWRWLARHAPVVLSSAVVGAVVAVLIVAPGQPDILEPDQGHPPVAESPPAPPSESGIPLATLTPAPPPAAEPEASEPLAPVPDSGQAAAGDDTQVLAATPPPETPAPAPAPTPQLEDFLPGQGVISLPPIVPPVPIPPLPELNLPTLPDLGPTIPPELAQPSPPGLELPGPPAAGPNCLIDVQLGALLSACVHLVVAAPRLGIFVPGHGFE